MDTEALSRPLLTSATTGSSFEQETRDLLEGRLRVIAATGFIISLAADAFFGATHHHLNGPEHALSPWKEPIYWLFPLMFGAATVALIVRRWNTRQLLIIDVALISTTLALSHVTASMFWPEVIPVTEVALLLFLHASLIPVPVSYQIWLAALGAVGYPVVSFVAYAMLPGLQEYWVELGGAGAFRATVLTGTFLLSLLAVVSVLITKALYHMRKSLHAAQRLGNYLIQRELGRGGMGKVFAAEHALIRRPTAIKVLDRPPGGEGAALARFEREVRLSATLTHPNTITIYDFGHTADNTFFYAMEYLEGLDLQRLVKQFGPIPAERVLYILDQACGSLVEAHSRKIVHRDIKPSNIFLTHRGGLYDFVKVLDFGLAKEVEASDSAITKAGMVFGTPLYLAPEMALGAEVADYRVDLYGLGGVAYWMLAGTPPFGRSTGMQAIIDNVKATPDPPAQVSEMDIPPELDAIVMRLLEKKPDDRFQSAAEIRTALRTVALASTWGQEQAEEWWSLHAPDDERVAECVMRAEAPADSLGLTVPVTATPVT